MPGTTATIKLYNELSEWYPLLTSLFDYEEEANYFHKVLSDRASVPNGTMLELGCGAGHNAFYLKQWYHPTLTDLSEKMLDLSRRNNPELEHFRGDMRELRLQRMFDIVFIHDAIMYMKHEEDLKKAIVTAFVHCKPGGTLLITPDCVKETFKPSTDHGGEDGDGRGLRYLEWTTGPTDSGTYLVDYIIALREADGEVTTFVERHEEGLFSENEWLKVLGDEGFKAEAIPDHFGRINFVGVKPS